MNSDNYMDEHPILMRMKQNYRKCLINRFVLFDYVEAMSRS